MNLPNALTLLRIFFVPLLVAALVQGAVQVDLGLFTVGNEMRRAMLRPIEFVAHPVRQTAHQEAQPVQVFFARLRNEITVDAETLLRRCRLFHEMAVAAHAQRTPEGYERAL